MVKVTIETFKESGKHNVIDTYYNISGTITNIDDILEVMYLANPKLTYADFTIEIEEGNMWNKVLVKNQDKAKVIELG